MRPLALRGAVRPPCSIGDTLRRLARWAIAGSLTAATGCGGDDLTKVNCEDVSNVLRNPTFARELDYLGLFLDYNVVPRTGVTGGMGINRLGWSGTPCKSADDKDACMSAFEAATMLVESCRPGTACGVFGVVTAGDRVSQFAGRGELLSWLGPIDSLSDALAVSRWDRKPLECAQTLVRGTYYEHDGDRFLFDVEWDNCSDQLQRDTWQVSERGVISESNTEKIGESGCAIGRRPEGLCPVERRFAAGTLAAHFAEIAHLEAASVFAFERLARELTSFGAPANLIARAASSAREEIRHAQLMSTVARGYGAEPYQVRISKLRARGLYQLALENAVEGCIHETYGALVAHHQAACATDPALRQAMRQIAHDETNHADLAWQIAAWLHPKLSATQQAELARAQVQALQELEQAQCRPTLPPSAASAIGLPQPTIARALVQRLKNLHTNLAQA